VIGNQQHTARRHVFDSEHLRSEIHAVKKSQRDRRVPRGTRIEPERVAAEVDVARLQRADALLEVSPQKANLQLVGSVPGSRAQTLQKRHCTLRYVRQSR
jgi:hypothetical protein